MRAARRLSREFVRSHPADAAHVLERLSIGEIAGVLEDLPPSIAAPAMERLSYLTSAECLSRLPQRRAAQILEQLPVDEATGRLLRLAPSDRERLLSELSSEAAGSLRRRLGYPDGTAGALVNARVPSFPDAITVAEALSRLRRASRFAQFYVYIVDGREALVGVLSLRELMLAPPRRSLASVMHSPAERLSADADRITILGHPGWQRVHALPVVDSEGRFMGVLEYETLRRLEAESPDPSRESASQSFGLAFGDLCWIGMTKLLGGVAEAVARPPAVERKLGRGDHGQD